MKIKKLTNKVNSKCSIIKDGVIKLKLMMLTQIERGRTNDDRM